MPVSDLRVSVTNFLGVRDISIPLADGPQMIIGPNASGKTSLATATAGILAHDSNPLGLQSASRYRHSDAETAEVALYRSDAEMARWTVGEKEMRRFSECPDPLHPAALSLVDFIGRDTPTGRTQKWESLLLPEPDAIIGEMETQLTKLLPRAEQVDGILTTLRARGWVDTEKLYKEHMRDAKRAWSQVTGENWGSKKGDTWRPSTWQAKYEGRTELDATSDLEAAREALRVMQVDRAISDADIERAKQAKERLPAYRDEYGKANAAYAQAARDASGASERANRIVLRGKQMVAAFDAHENSKPKLDESVACPYCGKPIVVMPDGTLRKAADEDAFRARLSLWKQGKERMESELVAMRETSVALRRKEAEAKTALAKAEGTRNGAYDVLREAERDARLAGEEATEAPDEGRLNRAEQRVSDAQEALDAISKNRKAREHHQTVLEYDAITTILGPRGPRATKLNEGVATIHEIVGEICDVADWPTLELDKSYAVHLDQRPVVIASGSEKWRAQFLLQCAVAILLGEQRVIADGADVLRYEQWVALYKVCEHLHRKHKLSVMVFATALKADTPNDWPCTEMVK